MKRVVATGRTVEDAVTSALVRLGVTKSQATVRVLQEPSKGILGIFGAKDAEVEVTVQLTPPETAQEFLSDLLRQMGLEASVKLRSGVPGGEEDHALDINCAEDALPVVIGRHGSTLDSLQYLVNIVANKSQDRYLKFSLDAGDYRRRRKEGLWRIAERAAIRAIRTRKPVPLDSMNAADRKVIHTYIQERRDVTTTSEGTEPNRKVVVIPVVQSESNRPMRPRKERV